MIRMPLRLYNTETRSVDTFKSIEVDKVGIYTCGPTVYHYAHIGNLRTYVFEDMTVDNFSLDIFQYFFQNHLCSKSSIMSLFNN